MNKAQQLFLAGVKNTRTVNIIQALLDNESPSELARQYDISRRGIYKIKEKYVTH